MYYITKFLLLPLVIIGVIGNNCYSMENNKRIIDNTQNNIRSIKYLDNGSSNEKATWEQWTKRANFDPIDAFATEYDNFHKFCKNHNFISLREGVRNFLVDIYNLANSLIYSHEFDSSSITSSTRRWIAQRTRNNEEILHLNKQNTHPAFFPLKKIKSIIRIAQKKLNPNKYSANNDIDNIPFAPGKEFKLMEGCYYLANQLVQLTHDIVYAINNKVKEYKKDLLSGTKNLSNEQLYTEFRQYLIEQITAPCYKALVEAFSYFISNDDSLIINNITLNPNTDQIKYDFFDYLSDEFDMKRVKYNLVYNFSNLNTELYSKHKGFINTLINSAETIKNNMPNISTVYIRNDLLILNNPYTNELIAEQYTNILQYPRICGASIVKNIDNKNITTNNEIINSANDCLQEIRNETYDTIRNVHKLYLYNYNVDMTKKEECEFAQYECQLKTLNKALNAFNMQIPDKEYLNEIQELLKKY